MYTVKLIKDSIASKTTDDIIISHNVDESVSGTNLNICLNWFKEGHFGKYDDKFTKDDIEKMDKDIIAYYPQADVVLYYNHTNDELYAGTWYEYVTYPVGQWDNPERPDLQEDYEKTSRFNGSQSEKLENFNNDLQREAKYDDYNNGIAGIKSEKQLIKEKLKNENLTEEQVEKLMGKSGSKKDFAVEYGFYPSTKEEREETFNNFSKEDQEKVLKVAEQYNVSVDRLIRKYLDYHLADNRNHEDSLKKILNIKNEAKINALFKDSGENMRNYNEEITLLQQRLKNEEIKDKDFIEALQEIQSECDDEEVLDRIDLIFKGIVEENEEKLTESILSGKSLDDALTPKQIEAHEESEKYLKEIDEILSRKIKSIDTLIDANRDLDSIEEKLCTSYDFNENFSDDDYEKVYEKIEQTRKGLKKAGEYLLNKKVTKDSIKEISIDEAFKNRYLKK